MYASGEAPVWLHVHYGRQRGAKPWNRVRLRLSDETWFDDFVPPDLAGQPPFQYISEGYWRTADVSGKSLVLAPDRREAFLETAACVAYVRLEAVAGPETWPRETKRLVTYYDGNFMGHFVASPAEVASQIAPLARSDCRLVLWNTCREDTCYYPTRVGHVLPDHGTPGLYPHWMGRDLHEMLRRGEDPLREACRVAHAAGLQIFASYRRLTCRLPPHAFPLHPKAMLAARPDLWCRGEAGEPLPHLSLAFPEVRRRMIDLLSEQAGNYDLDGVHFFFCRGVPFVLFEDPFLAAFDREFGEDPRRLPLTDERVWRVRAGFVLALFRDLRARLDAIGRRRGRQFEVAVTVMNRPATSAYFGLDVEALIRERLVDVLLPFPCHYLPPDLGESRLLPEFVREFADLARGSGVRIYPDAGYDYSAGAEPLWRRAAAFYAAGADGLQISQCGVRHGVNSFVARLGHVAELDQAEAWTAQAVRAVRVAEVAGLSLDPRRGIATCG